MWRRDIFELMDLLRGRIGRNIFGFFHEGLFTLAMASSKVLTEMYYNVVYAALDFVCDTRPFCQAKNPSRPMPDWPFQRHAYGRKWMALLLSGGPALLVPDALM
jgi:hypothetical protein